MDSLTQQPAWLGMTDAVSELRTSGDRFEQFVSELLQDLENLQGELQQRGRELERQARQLFVERDRIATEQGAVSESLALRRF